MNQFPHGQRFASKHSAQPSLADELLNRLPVDFGLERREVF